MGQDRKRRSFLLRSVGHQVNHGWCLLGQYLQRATAVELVAEAWILVLTAPVEVAEVAVVRLGAVVVPVTRDTGTKRHTCQHSGQQPSGSARCASQEIVFCNLAVLTKVQITCVAQTQRVDLRASPLLEVAQVAALLLHLGKERRPFDAVV